MRKIIYDVATSIDGFICSPTFTVEGFLSEGEHISEYRERLTTYDTVLLGRATYEWGYAFGLKPGTRAYPHMKHYIFSKTLNFGSNEEVTVVRDHALQVIEELKNQTGTDIYLCGGGTFAGFLLANQMIDSLILKVNPVIFIQGVRIFQGEYQPYSLVPTKVKAYPSGVHLLHYDIKYL